MSLEVIIPAYKPDEKLARIIKKLNKQIVKPDKITILLTVRSDDEVASLASTLPSDVTIIPITVSDFTHGGTRQLGMDRATSDYVLFMTQDAVPVDDAMTQNLIRALSEPSACMAYARQIPYKDADDIEKFNRKFNYPKTSHSQTENDLETKGIKAIFCSDSCAMYKRAVHNILGGFDRTTQFNEDSIFAYKAITNGYTVEYCAEARVYHSHNLSLTEQFRRNRDIARSQKEHPEVYENIVSEKEGVKYVFTGIDYFIRRKQPKTIFRFLLTAAVRYAGFFSGKHFDKSSFKESNS